jgi:hypothetical protein
MKKKSPNGLLYHDIMEENLHLFRNNQQLPVKFKKKIDFSFFLKKINICTVFQNNKVVESSQLLEIQRSKTCLMMIESWGGRIFILFIHDVSVV